MVRNSPVLDQAISNETPEWHLHQDLVVALGLKREGDVWLRPREGYVDVAKLIRNKDNSPKNLSIRAGHLKDYLCARSMALYVTSYRDRVEITEGREHISWQDAEKWDGDEANKWSGRVMEIHEGGQRFGEVWNVVRTGRTDIDNELDVPVAGGPSEGDYNVSTSARSFAGRKLFRIGGEIWKNEWISPAQHSPLVLNDDVPPTAYFITDAEGSQETRQTLISEGRWLWFKPDVIPMLVHRRGGGLRWYTRDTGAVWCAPIGAVDFGVNALGLVTVFAKDVAQLDDWQQKIWSGFNVVPDGGVSKELLMSQMECQPADTLAPESVFAEALKAVNDAAAEKLGVSLFRAHDQAEDILQRCHRFRACDEAGLLSLAKDLARLTADSIDANAIRRVIPATKEKLGSLKSLERLIAMKRPNDASIILSALFGTYELRLADAHLAGNGLKESYDKLGISPDGPFVVRGRELIRSVATSLAEIYRVLCKWNEGSNETS